MNTASEEDFLCKIQFNLLYSSVFIIFSYLLCACFLYAMVVGENVNRRNEFNRIIIIIIIIITVMNRGWLIHN
jgi:hypothetical protein